MSENLKIGCLAQFDHKLKKKKKVGGGGGGGGHIGGEESQCFISAMS